MTLKPSQSSARGFCTRAQRLLAPTEVADLTLPVQELPSDHPVQLNITVRPGNETELSASISVTGREFFGTVPAELDEALRTPLCVTDPPQAGPELD